MSIKPVRTVIIPLAFNHPLLDPHCTGAVCRFEAGISNEDINTTLIIQTAGTSAQKPRTNKSNSLSVEMQQYLHKYNHPWKDRFIPYPITWGTRGEIRSGLRYIRQLGVANTDDNIRIVISSSPWHIFRIKLWYTWMYKPENWDVEYKTSRDDLSLKDKFMEILKHAHDALYTIGCLYDLYRLKRFKNFKKSKHLHKQ